MIYSHVSLKVIRKKFLLARLWGDQVCRRVQAAQRSQEAQRSQAQRIDGNPMQGREFHWHCSRH